MSGLAFVSLLFPGGVLEPMWQLNPSAREAFSRSGIYAIALMSAVCIACALAGIGLLRQSRRGYLLAIALLAINMVGAAVNTVVRDDFRALIGLPIAGLMIAYLVMPNVRRWFIQRSDA